MIAILDKALEELKHLPEDTQEVIVRDFLAQIRAQRSGGARARQMVAMAEVVRLSEEAGLYESDGPPPPKSVYRGKSLAKP
jgi:hypothetical protein